ncbi:hypothetical protein OG234_13365 [Streptomyces sp. NBC_01420]|uniref:hypothetical protein n=1 Tax=Streptomyces sp. NBC_01420 TaxID=2903858 RepID=UPI0032567D93
MRNVTAHTLTVFTAATDAGMAFADVTVLLVRMTAAQVSDWKWIGDETTGQDPVEGYEIRDTEGALLGAVIPLGHRARRLHVEWYDAEAGDFFPAGETDNVLTQGIARVLEYRFRNVGPVPSGEDFAPQLLRRTRNKTCAFNYCFDAECVDHGQIWAKAA